MINHNDSMDEAFQVLESSPCPIAQAFCRKWRDEMGMTMAEMEAQLGELEDTRDAAKQISNELVEVEAENKRLEARETELERRIENCSELLWRFRPGDSSRTAGQFGEEYEWNEYPEDIHVEYAPDYESINAAFVKQVDGEVEEVWVLPKGDMYSKRALYERVY